MGATTGLGGVAPPVQEGDPPPRQAAVIEMFSNDIQEAIRQFQKLVDTCQSLSAEEKEKAAEMFSHILTNTFGRIQNVLLHAEERLHRAEQINLVLFNISKALNTIEDVDQLYAEIHRQVESILDAKNFFIATYDEQHDTLSAPYFADEKDKKTEIAHALKVRHPGTLSAEVIQSGQPLLLSEEEIRERYKDGTRKPVGTIPRSWLGAPLIVESRPLGVLVVQSYEHDNAYTSEDAATLSTIGDQIAFTLRRKKIEQELRDSEKRYKEVVDEQGEGVCTVDENEQFIFSNKAADRLFGVPEGDTLAGKNLRDFTSDEAFQHIKKQTRKRKAGKQSKYDFEIHVQGRKRVIRVTATPRFDEHKHFVGSFGILQDVTKLRAVEAALRQKAMEFDSIFKAIPDLYFRLSNDGRVLAYKAGSKSDLYVPPHVFMGRILHKDVLPHELGETFKRVLDEVVQTKQQRIIEYCLNIPEHGEQSFEARIRPLTEDQVVIFIRNITEQKRLQQALEIFSQGHLDYTMKILEDKDLETEQHTRRVEEMLIKFTEILGHPLTRNIKLLARYHDIGKIGIPDDVLKKPGLFTEDEERRIMQLHSEIGYSIALSSPVLQPIARWILLHHKWFNREGGYPKSFEGELPMECRMLMVIDSFDAMMHDRRYRKALSVDQALYELQTYAGTQFDPELVKIFIEHHFELFWQGERSSTGPH